MPQLSPLSWFWFFIGFWALLFILVAMVWWLNVPTYKAPTYSSKSKRGWEWC